MSPWWAPTTDHQSRKQGVKEAFKKNPTGPGSWGTLTARSASQGVVNRAMHKQTSFCTTAQKPKGAEGGP